MSALSVLMRRTAALAAAAIVTTLIALTLGAFSSSASASPYPPSSACTVSTTTANAGPGSSVTLVGSGFAPNQSVSLSIPSASAALGTVTTTSSGSFRGTFTWPASVNGRSAVVQANAPSTSCSFTLVNQSGNGPTGGHRGNSNGSGGLSSTGFATMTATTIALALIAGGAIFLGLARRKRV